MPGRFFCPVVNFRRWHDRLNGEHHKNKGA
nr:MAG TPA: hypothetical protein [Caudoviricetes sp.]DAV62824.1 MAG TPA: hypothetical protein [Caudoviricetes sp.]DAZ64581.1 MAG TPA: hypothetical protein [Caudoviricetes sp.]